MKDTKKPNIIVILSDQHRYDAVSANGNGICRTPAIDSLAADGMTFDSAYTSCALCTPARATLVTGLYPHNHGELANIGNFNGVFDRQIIGKPHLNHYLKEQGYRIGMAGKWHLPDENKCDVWETDEWYSESNYHTWLKTDRGLDYDRGRCEVQRLEWTGDAPFCGANTLPAEDMHETWVTDHVVDMIDRFSKEDEPFMIHCNYFAPHFPYAAPKPFDTMYEKAAESIPMWNNFNDMFVNKPTVQQSEMLRWNSSHLTWKGTPYDLYISAREE